MPKDIYTQSGHIIRRKGDKYITSDGRKLEPSQVKQFIKTIGGGRSYDSSEVSNQFKAHAQSLDRSHFAELREDKINDLAKQIIEESKQ